MAHPSEIAASVIVLVVAGVALGLAALAWQSRRRTGDNRLTFVAGAFALLATKSIIVAVSLNNGMIGHQHLELLAALFDLGVVTLLALPLVR